MAAGRETPAASRSPRSRRYLGKKSSVAWWAKSISGWGHTPKSTVTPVQIPMASALSAGTGTRLG